MYAQVFNRPDLAFVISVLSKFPSNVGNALECSKESVLDICKRRRVTCWFTRELKTFAGFPDNLKYVDL